LSDKRLAFSGTMPYNFRMEIGTFQDAYPLMVGFYGKQTATNDDGIQGNKALYQISSLHSCLLGADHSKTI